MQNVLGLISRFDTTKERISELSDGSRNYPNETKNFEKEHLSSGVIPNNIYVIEIPGENRAEY